jgi:hypothetical protein
MIDKKLSRQGANSRDSASVSGESSSQVEKKSIAQRRF